MGTRMKRTYTIAPSCVIKKKKDFIDATRTLNRLGFTFIKNILPGEPLKIQEKVKQIHRAFKDDKTELILAQRGGHSSMKILPYIDWNLIKKNPKLFAGFSDVSTLLNAIYERTGIVTLHSPMGINFTKPTPFTVRSFMNALNGFPGKDLFAGAPVKVYNPGSARGVLKGGNLVTLSALLGTPWEIDVDGAILFFEDVDEKPHEVDRLLSHWILAGKMHSIKGLILGDFRGVRNLEAWRVVTEQMKVPFPVVHCPYIGHVKNKITLPIGARVKLDTKRKSLEMLPK